MPAKIEPFYTDVGSRIRDLRTRSGMTQEQLGRLLAPPTTRVSIANIEGGHQRILCHTLVQLAAALNVGVQDILPKKPEPAVLSDNSAITEELVTKLRIPLSVAEDIAEKAKNN